MFYKMYTRSMGALRASVVIVCISMVAGCSIPDNPLGSFKRLKFWESDKGNLYTHHVINKVGTPHATSTEKFDSTSVEQLSYFYSDEDAKSGADDGKLGVKVQTFFAYAGTGKIFGEMFTSSFKADSTRFSMSAVRKVKPGMNEDKVRSILGKPPGTLNTGSEDGDIERQVYVYGYPSNRRGLLMARIVFNPDNKVEDVSMKTIRRFW